MNSLPDKSRKHPRHFPIIPWQGNRRHIYFVTLCTDKRKAILAFPDVHALFDDVIHTTEGWWVSQYLIMPDHIHLFCQPHGDCVIGTDKVRKPSLSAWVKCVKARVSMRWPRPQEQPIWQRDFWDTEIRSERYYQSRWNYVRGNPVRKGLVQKPEDWPYVGACFPR
ncbi:MAG: transposase [Opitutaceae bacterium]|nr:transposase [Opitutaceae bacterium]